MISWIYYLSGILINWTLNAQCLPFQNLQSEGEWIWKTQWMPGRKRREFLPPLLDLKFLSDMCIFSSLRVHFGIWKHCCSRVSAKRSLSSCLATVVFINSISLHAASTLLWWLYLMTDISSMFSYMWAGKKGNLIRLPYPKVGHGNISSCAELRIWHGNYLFINLFCLPTHLSSQLQMPFENSCGLGKGLEM